VTTSIGPLSLQQLDPLGTLDGRSITVVAAGGVVAISSIMTVRGFEAVTSPLLAGIAILLVLIAALVVVRGTSPSRTSFSAVLHVTVLGLLVAAYAVSSASLGPAGSLLINYWGPLVIGIISAALAPYRPVRHLITVGVLVAAVTGVVAFIQSQSSNLTAPASVVVLVALTPVLTMSLGGSAFANSIARTHRRWVSRAQSASQRQLERQQVSVARSVQQDRVTILNRDIVPLFVDVSTHGTISSEHRVRAAEYSESIRELMVNEVNRSWLEALITETFEARDDIDRVRDPHRLAAAMTPSQQAALRAAVLAVASGSELVRDSVRLVIEQNDTVAVVVVTATVASPELPWRSFLDPYFAVLRVVFTGLNVSYRSPSLTVRFTYDIP